MATMDHAKANELFDAYCDKELAADDARALEEHLATCEACRSDLALYQKTIGGAHRLAHLPAPPDLVEGTIDRVRRRSGGRFFGPRRLTDRLPITLLSMIMLGVVLAIYLYVRLGDPAHLLVP